MLLWITTLRPERGKQGAAVAWAKECIPLINQAIEPVRPVEVFAEVFGNAGLIYFVGGYRDWAHIQKHRDWAATDQKALAILRRSADEGLFVHGTRKDIVLEST